MTLTTTDNIPFLSIQTNHKHSSYISTVSDPEFASSAARAPCHSLKGLLEDISVELETTPSPKTMTTYRHPQLHPLHPGTLIEGDRE